MGLPGVTSLRSTTLGRPVKTIREHLLQGTMPQGKSQAESYLPPSRPRFPKDVAPVARKVYKELCCVLEDRRALTRGDFQLLRLFAILWDRHQRQEKLLRDEGEVTTYTRLDSNGQAHDVVKENIRLKIVVGAEKQLVAILDKLGLSPNAKDKVRPTKGEEKPEDPMEQFLARRPSVVSMPVRPEDMKASDEDAEEIVDHS
jgi:P27 family predicted phage terminase small subunit